MAKDPSLLFHPNPPPEEWRARLFHNRLKELDIGLSKLRSTAASTELLAIHGDTRTGKSHYAHRLLDLAIEELGGVAVIVNANQRETAQHVLEDLFASLAIELQGLDRSHVQDRPVYDELIQFIEVFKPLVFGKVQEKELTEGRKLLSKTSATLGLKPTFAEFSLGFEASTEDGTSEKVVLHAPQGKQLAEFVRWLCEGVEHLCKKRVFILVDDQDLLSTTPEGLIQTAELVGGLKLIAASTKVTVLVTVRTKYWTAKDKDFVNFARIHHLGDRDLQAIHRLRIAQLNGGEELFSPAALKWLIATSDGRVGMYLQRAQRVHEHFWGLGRKISQADLRSYIKSELAEFVGNPAVQGPLIQVYAAVRAGGTEVQIDGIDENSPLYLTMLQPLPPGPRFSIDPLYLKVIQTELTAG